MKGGENGVKGDGIGNISAREIEGQGFSRWRETESEGRKERASGEGKRLGKGRENVSKPLR
jgi:ribosomal protein L19E